jgi:septation ring formation regulator EzrA
LKQEIDEIAKMTPLIEEKISLELKAIKLILDAQQETDTLLLKARDKYADAYSRNKLTHMKADKEIEAINEDLNNCRNSLAKAKSVFVYLFKLINVYVISFYFSEKDWKILF